jgi:hypothetical protein
MSFVNCYEDASRADAYASLEFANTYYLAYRSMSRAREHLISAVARGGHHASCKNLGSR